MTLRDAKDSIWDLNPIIISFNNKIFYNDDNYDSYGMAKAIFDKFMDSDKLIYHISIKVVYEHHTEIEIFGEE